MLIILFIYVICLDKFLIWTSFGFFAVKINAGDNPKSSIFLKCKVYLNLRLHYLIFRMVHLYLAPQELFGDHVLRLINFRIISPFSNILQEASLWSFYFVSHRSSILFAQICFSMKPEQAQKSYGKFRNGRKFALHYSILTIIGV